LASLASARLCLLQTKRTTDPRMNPANHRDGPKVQNLSSCLTRERLRTRCTLLPLFTCCTHPNHP
jgi:hypothetical protein